MSLIPFTTSWLGEHHHYLEPLPVATYGFVLLMCAIAYVVLEQTLKKYHDDNYALAKLSKSTFKDYVSTGLYIIALPLAYVNTWFAVACYVIVAIIWIMPERKLEELMEELED